MKGKFTLIWASMLKSSVWLTMSKETRLVWVAMLLMKEADGVVRSGVPGIAHDAVLSPEEVRKALKELSLPDKDTNTQEHEGRRIKRVAEGWLILNHEKYRTSADIQEKWRRQKADQRARKEALEPDDGPSDPGIQESFENLKQAESAGFGKPLTNKTKEEMAEIQEDWAAKRKAESDEHLKYAEKLRSGE